MKFRCVQWNFFSAFYFSFAKFKRSLFSVLFWCFNPLWTQASCLTQVTRFRLLDVSWSSTQSKVFSASFHNFQIFVYIISSSVGTFQIRGADIIFSVLDHALATGYRHIGEFTSSHRHWIIDFKFHLPESIKNSWWCIHLRRFGCGIQERATYRSRPQNAAAQV